MPENLKEIWDIWVIFMLAKYFRFSFKLNNIDDNMEGDSYIKSKQQINHCLCHTACLASLKTHVRISQSNLIKIIFLLNNIQQWSLCCIK
jgi:hypothetical protein